MSAPVTTELIWSEIEKRLFAVLGFVTHKGHGRTVGIVYVVRDRQLYIISGRPSWKTRHIARNPSVSVTVTIPKRVPFLPWIKIPDATITFQGEAAVQGVDDVDPEIFRALTRGVELETDAPEKYCIIRVKPRGEFVTYGVGVPLLAMSKPEKARGRAPVH